jgi:hypothetical protein
MTHQCEIDLCRLKPSLNAQELLELVAYLCNWFLGLAPDDTGKAEKLVDYLQERGLIKRAPPAPANELVASARDGDALLDVREAAELLNCSTKWIYLNYEKLPHIPMGAGSKPRLRFRRTALLAWIERNEIDWRKKR